MANSILQESLGSLVANQLRNKIWGGEIQFGERLLITGLSEEFDVSRSTVRDALKILEYEELVISKPRKGAYVAEFSKKDWKEIIDLRTIVEAFAFVKALPKLEQRHFRFLEDILMQMQAEIKSENWGKLFDLDLQFHSYVINLSDNKRVIKLYESIKVQIRTFLIYLDDYYSSYQSFYDEQKELFDALVTKDPIIVDRQIRTHIRYVEGKTLAGS